MEELHLSVRVERPVEGCRLKPHGSLIATAQTDGGPVRRTVDKKDYLLMWRWYKGKRRPNCANPDCAQAHSYSALDWRTNASKGYTLQCVPCLKLHQPRWALTFCGADCFRAAWPEHRKRHAVLCASAKASKEDLKSRSPVLSAMELEAEDGRDEEESWELVSTNSAYVPTEMDVGCCLRVEISAVRKPDGEHFYGPQIVRTEPVLSMPPPVPKRQLLTMSGVDHSAGQRVRVVTYNVLAEIYATKQAYPYCDYWALTWEYRRQNLLREIGDAGADIVCLQEVQADHYEEHWGPLLGDMGFEGIYKQKTREAMGAAGKVDGCATFWRRGRFRLCEHYAVEFNEAAYREAQALNLSDREEHAFLTRLMKDNIAQISVLEFLTPPHQRQLSAPVQLCVANTHLYSNKDFPDVKLWQTFTLTQELEHFVLGRSLPVVICGDFNSGPESCVYEFLSTSMVRGNHPELENFGADIDVLPEIHNVAHRLQLSSAFATVTGSEPTYTNFTKGFVGTLDYIWFGSADIMCAAIAGIPSEDVLTHGGEAMPNTQFSSDHIMMMTDLIIYDYNSPSPTQNPGAGNPSGLMYSPGPGLRMHSHSHSQVHNQTSVYVANSNTANPSSSHSPANNGWAGLRVRGSGQRL